MTKKIIKIIIVVLLILYSSNISAEESQKISTSLTNHALNLIDKENVSEAITELSQALLIDPYNTFAAEQLITIFDNLPTNSEQKVDLLLFRDLYAYLEHLKGHIQYFEEKTANMKKYLLDRNLPENMLSKELDSINAALNRQKIPKTNDKESPIRAVIETMQITANQLRIEIQIAKMQFNHLRLLNHKYSDKHPCNNVIFNPPVLVVGETVNIDPSSITVLKRQIGIIQKQIFSLREDLLMKDEKIQSLSTELIDFALKLKEHENAIAQKTDTITSMNEQFAEMNSRIELNHQIVLNKDKAISNLQKEIEKNQGKILEQSNKMEVVLNKKIHELHETQGVLNIYKEKLTSTNDELKTKNTDISALKDQLNMVKNNLFKKGEELKNAEEKILTLQDELKNLQINCKKGLSLNSTSVNKLAKQVVILHKNLQQINLSILQDIYNFDKIKSSL